MFARIKAWLWPAPKPIERFTQQQLCQLVDTACHYQRQLGMFIPRFVQHDIAARLCSEFTDLSTSDVNLELFTERFKRLVDRPLPGPSRVNPLGVGPIPTFDHAAGLKFEGQHVFSGSFGSGPHCIFCGMWRSDDNLAALCSGRSPCK